MQPTSLPALRDVGHATVGALHPKCAESFFQVLDGVSPIALAFRDARGTRRPAL